jgi:single-strand DNA-binding protein
MAMSFNRVTLVGYLGQDPTSTFLPSGDQATHFRVACTERWKDRSGVQQEQTLWFSCSTYGRLAERSQQFLRKGAYVYVEGRLSTREYADRQGQQRTSLDVRCSAMYLLDRFADASAASGDRLPAGTNDDVDEVPF